MAFCPVAKANYLSCLSIHDVNVVAIYFFALYLLKLSIATSFPVRRFFGGSSWKKKESIYGFSRNYLPCKRHVLYKFIIIFANTLLR